jgi:WD40 repeat protein
MEPEVSRNSVNGGDAANAFVGPRPFPSTRQLYGRDVELLTLSNRLLSERLVLLYSPSGAGKSSLLMARGGIRERMLDEGFALLPTVRVAISAAVAVRAGVNRYLLSTLESLEQGRPKAERRPIEELVDLLRGKNGASDPAFFENYLAALASSNKAEQTGTAPQQLLVFDQFEELLTLDPTDGAAKQEFLAQIGQALRNADRWALFAMREDFVAALDPYLPQLPTRLAARFRLDFLGKAAAHKAAQGPPAEAEFGGVVFEEQAVTQLVDELARIRVQDPVTGKAETRDGPYVEPLHLQLVCQRLWKERERPDRITKADLDRLGDAHAADLRGVDAALAEYYAGEIRRVADQFTVEKVTERKIRDWFGRALLSDDGLRLPVLLGKENEYGLTPAVLAALAEGWLIRSEQRHGGVYYELAHDRLVKPVRHNNDAWRATNLSEFQQRAELWKRSGERAGLLIGGTELAACEKWFADHPEEFGEYEQAFLQACQQAETDRRERELRKWSRRRNRVVIVALVGLILAGGTAWGLSKLRDAELQDQEDKYNKLLRAESEKLKQLNLAHDNYIDAWRDLADDPSKSIEPARRALDGFRSNSAKAPDGLWKIVLPQALANQGLTTFGRTTDETELGTEIVGARLPVTELRLGVAKERLLLSRDSRGNVQIWRDPPTEMAKPVQTIRNVNRMAVTPDGRYLLAGHTYGWVCRWDLDRLSNDHPYESDESPIESPITALEIAGPGKPPVVTVGYRDGRVKLIRLDESMKEEGNERSPGSARPIADLVIAAKAKKVLIDVQDGEISTWDLARWLEGKKELPPIRPANPKIETERYQFTSGPDGVFAFAVRKGRVLVYLVEEPLVKVAEITTGYIEDTNDTQDDQDRKRRVKFLAIGPVRQQSGEVRSVDILVATEAGVVTLHRATTTDRSWTCGKGVRLLPNDPLPVHPNLAVHPNVATFSPAGKWLAIGRNNGTTLVWPLDGMDKDVQPKHILQATESAVTALLFDQGGRIVYTGQTNGSIRRWDLQRQRNIEDVREEFRNPDRTPKRLDEIAAIADRLRMSR